jgi:hypothetical protein
METLVAEFGSTGADGNTVSAGRAVLASSFMLTILAMVETATSKLCQLLVFIRHSVLLQPMTAIKFYHHADCLFFSLYSTFHIGVVEVITPFLLIPLFG